MFIVVANSAFYFYSTCDWYGLSSNIKDATFYTLKEANLIAEKYKHWENIEIKNAPN